MKASATSARAASDGGREPWGLRDRLVEGVPGIVQPRPRLVKTICQAFWVSEVRRYWTTRDRPTDIRLYRLASEIRATVDPGMGPAGP